ncbi:hypothetical protein B0H13DRAFT_1914419 [Mycena leptocephala]|nr:hypothetical protein B0H13DRAFT_1914419 [Mycena leptocephala]
MASTGVRRLGASAARKKTKTKDGWTKREDARIPSCRNRRLLMQLRIANEIATAKIRRQNRGDWRWKYSRSGSDKKPKIASEVQCIKLKGEQEKAEASKAREIEWCYDAMREITAAQINVERLKDVNHARRGRKIEKSLDGEDSTAERGKERLISVLCWIIFGQYEISR